MKHYLCEIIETGEEILVGADSAAEAKALMADEWLMDVKVLCAVSEFEAEMSGLDEY